MPNSLGDGAALLALVKALPPERRKQGLATAALMLAGAFAEVVSVGAAFPFLLLLMSPERVTHAPVIGRLVTLLPPGTSVQAAAGIIFLAVILVCSAIRLVLAWQSNAFAFNVSHDLSLVAFRKILSQPYEFYLRTNSSEMLSKFEKIHALTYSVLVAGVQAIISTIISVCLIGLLLYVDPAVAAISAFVVVGTYGLISVLVRSSLAANSTAIAQGWADRIKRVQEAVGGIRDILIDRSHQVFEDEFEASSRKLTRALTVNSYIGAAPRIGIEFILVALIGLLAWYVAGQPGGITSAVPRIGALALGAQRLMPLLQISYVGWSQFLGSKQSWRDVSSLIALPSSSPSSQLCALPFCTSIEYEGVGFAYDERKAALQNVSFRVEKGERIGIVGKTGAGKSTLMDVLLGLLTPTAGRILVDGQPLNDETRPAWQAKVAHVPQGIYLTDDTLAANIAFGVPAAEIDMARVAVAGQAAGMGDFVVGLPEGYMTTCGERGMRLSGGQRQRVGIARALYRRAEILVLDEATSALDSATEEAVMTSINGLDGNLTIFMIAHRLSSLEGCDRFFSIEGGRIVHVSQTLGELLRHGSDERKASAGSARRGPDAGERFATKLRNL